MNLKLIKNTENINKEKITLFCLPFAGGGASAYNQWAKKMQGKVTVCLVQLPGREERIMEKPYIDPVYCPDSAKQDLLALKEKSEKMLKRPN